MPPRHPVKLKGTAESNWRFIGQEVSEQLNYEPGRFLPGNYAYNPDPQGVPGPEGATQFRNIRISDVKITSKNLLTIDGPVEKPVDGVFIAGVSGVCSVGSVIQNARNVVLQNINLQGISGPIFITNNVLMSEIAGAIPLQKAKR